VHWSRALASWLLIVAAESVNGTIRQLWIAPVLGDVPARQLGVLTGSLIILAVAWATIRWIGARTMGEQLRVGLLWVVLIVAFEFALGTALGASRARLLSDYNPAAGGLMGAGLLVMLWAPVVAARARPFRHGAP
jgi:hypothetical protein